MYEWTRGPGPSRHAKCVTTFPCSKGGQSHMEFFSPFPRRGKVPEGRMRAAATSPQKHELGYFKPNSECVLSSLRCGPHPPFGHLLPTGEGWVF
jgi:hypothetical protein